jgi:integrase
VLRHTCVSNLIKGGWREKEIQEWVRHDSIVETMDIYGHLFPNSLNKMSRKLNDYVDEKLVDPRKQRMLA